MTAEKELLHREKILRNKIQKLYDSYFSVHNEAPKIIIDGYFVEMISVKEDSK